MSFLLNNYKFRKLLLIFALLLPIALQAQTPDYSGTYYIGSRGYNSDTPNDNFYLCPTEGWYFYQATNNYTESDNGTPFLTTYTINNHSGYDISKAVWVLEKHPTEDDCYYIIQKKTGRYVVSNGQISGSTNPNRMRVHLELVADASALAALGDLALFVIKDSANCKIIRPHSTAGVNGANVYIVVNNNNSDYLRANPSGTKKDGPNGKYGKATDGVLGLYTFEDNARFYLEDIHPEGPVITNNYDGTATITAPTGTTVYYTTDGNTPTQSTPTSLTPPDDITLTDDIEVIKAIAVITIGGYDYSSTVTEYSLPTCPEPIITFADGNVSISCTTPGASLFYTTDGSNPTTSSTAYSTPFSISDPTTVKAIATHTGYLVSNTSVLSIDKVATPTIQNNGNNAISITCATSSVTIYYTTDGSTPTTSSSVYTVPLTGDVSSKTIKAIAVKTGMINSAVGTGSVTLKCAAPVIIRNGEGFSITCATASATVYYTDDGTTTPTSSSTLYSGPRVNHSLPVTIKAIAIATGYDNSDVTTANILEDLGGSGTVVDPFLITNQDEVGVFIEKANTIEGASAYYKVTATQPLDFGSALPITQAFSGTLDGNMKTFTGLTHPLFNTIDSGKVINLMVDNVAISSGTNVGAICGEATGASRIYNCGVLASNSTVEKDDDGYDEITSCSSTISGSGYVGSIVGLLDDSSRVVNCFSYANITGGSYRGGIVGKNNVAYDATSYKTMVMNCMFYGEITTTGSPTQIAPIYGGEIITNDGDANGVNNFNYFRIEASYIQNNSVTKVYNCALGAETRFLQRFEFYRHLLNSNRELAAWWATDNVANKEEIMKWVMEPTQIGSATPYPILKTPGKYASVVNYTPGETVYDGTEANRNKGHKLTSEGDNGVLHVTIQMGTNTGSTPFSAPSGAALKPGQTGTFDLTITDKDFEHFNFNYGKVQLPYYNDYCDSNYTGNRVVTGWKIVSITGGTAGSYSTGDDVTYTDGELTATPYNFADRKCTVKDLYDGTGENKPGADRVFNQGAYWDVPEGVTAITIEPYWGKAVYLADAYWDVTYKNNMTSASNVTNVGGGQRYTDGTSKFRNQIIYTSIGNAITSTGTGSALFQGESDAKNRTVYDYAVVLVGNYHNYNTIEASNTKPYTVTSVDLDGDNEPDYSYILRFDSRKALHPARVDFINIPGLGMVQKTTGGTGSYNFGIFQPKWWFESTNTSLFRVTQFEYDNKDRGTFPLILQGGVIEQWVCGQSAGAANKTTYFHVGGNVWFKEFHRGTHQDATHQSKHPPVSVTGGDFDEFYLTGLYTADVISYPDNAECYINGGCFGTLCGAAMEGIGKAYGADNTGNITWLIQYADIHEFYAGGLNASTSNLVTGNLSTTITGSHVDLFCGGPKFGDMSAGKTVTTTAIDCTFGTFFGAGYGGNSYSRQAPRNHSGLENFPHNDKDAGNDASWNAWLGRFYTQAYNSTYGGVSTQFSYQFLPMSGNTSNVARIFIEYVKFSLATTHNVTSTLNNCTVTGNFYGGGSLGKVDGDVTSTLNGCNMMGNVYGAGFSASLPTVEVDAMGFSVEPYYYTELGTYRTGVKGATTTYTWEEKTGSSWVDNTNHILYTTEDLTTLGTVTGNVTLTITDNSHIEGDVYGGGALSDANTDADNTTTVNILDGTYGGNIYGGGQGDASVAAKVNGVVTVNIGADDGTGNYTGNADLTTSSVFGCNNTNGSPQADVYVNIYHSAQTSGTNTVDDDEYAIHQVFGGGNAANYAPENGNAASTKKATVHIYTCDNTIRRVFGGGNAASSQGVAVEIDGGRFYWAFGGGNGESGIAANIGNGGVDITVNGGKFEHIFSGCNEYGTIAGPTTATLTNNSGCTEEIKEYFGGNNLMPATSDITTTISCDNEHPVRIIDLYGGSNLASITGNVTLNVEGGIIDNVFGGSKGTMETNAFITGNVELNLYGGTIGNAYGGSNINGSINGTITVNVYENSPCPLIITNVYGGGKNAAYTPTYTVGASEKRITPMVNILKGTVRNDVFGGGFGSGATVTANPKVASGTKVEGVAYRCTIGGNVFGGGSMAEVNGNTEVLIFNKTIVRGNIYGGGNEATVDGNTKVIVNDTTIP